MESAERLKRVKCLHCGSETVMPVNSVPIYCTACGGWEFRDVTDDPEVEENIIFI